MTRRSGFLGPAWVRPALVLLAILVLSSPAAAGAETEQATGEPIAVPDTDADGGKKKGSGAIDPKEFGGGFRIGFWAFNQLDHMGEPGIGVNPGVDWYLGMFRITLDYGYGPNGSVAFSSVGLAFPLRPIRPWVAARAGYIWGGGDEGFTIAPHWGFDLRLPKLNYFQFAWYMSPGIVEREFGFTVAWVLGM